MAKVTVRMYATVREAAGVAECELEAQSLSQVFDLLSGRFGSRLARLLSRSLTDPERLVVLVNGRSVRRGASGDPALSDGDEVSIFPPVSRG